LSTIEQEWNDYFAKMSEQSLKEIDKIEKTRLRRKIERIEKTRLNRLRRQD